MTQQLALNPRLDIKALAAEFGERRRLRIEKVLTKESANAIELTLKKHTPWQLAYTDAQSAPTVIDHNRLTQLSDADISALVSQVHGRAGKQYQFMYKTFHTISAIKRGLLTEQSMLYQLATFLNGTEFIRFARELTGVNTLVKVDPQATLYERNHFLNTHNDQGDKRDAEETGIRRFAIVLGFTQNWDANWGGNTTFYADKNTKEAETWYPDFNTLSIFEVPVLHRVSMVTPFAKHGRYSVTGWLREDPSVARPDLD